MPGSLHRVEGLRVGLLDMPQGGGRVRTRLGGSAAMYLCVREAGPGLLWPPLCQKAQGNGQGVSGICCIRLQGSTITPVHAAAQVTFQPCSPLSASAPEKGKKRVEAGTVDGPLVPLKPARLHVKQAIVPPGWLGSLVMVCHEQPGALMA